MDGPVLHPNPQLKRLAAGSADNGQAEPVARHTGAPPCRLDCAVRLGKSDLIGIVKGGQAAAQDEKRATCPAIPAPLPPGPGGSQVPGAGCGRQFGGGGKD